MNSKILFLLAATAITFGGCSLAPEYIKPQPPIAEQWPKGEAYDNTQKLQK